MRDMLIELEDVIIEWFKLGIFLEIPSSTLIVIRNSKKKVEECKISMLTEWSNFNTPTWEKLVTALVHTDLPAVAVKIATKHRKLHVGNTILISTVC